MIVYFSFIEVTTGEHKSNWTFIGHNALFN